MTHETSIVFIYRTPIICQIQQYVTENMSYLPNIQIISER
jgi:hypothetical protein